MRNKKCCWGAVIAALLALLGAAAAVMVLLRRHHTACTEELEDGDLVEYLDTEDGKQAEEYERNTQENPGEGEKTLDTGAQLWYSSMAPKRCHRRGVEQFGSSSGS